MSIIKTKGRTLITRTDREYTSRLVKGQTTDIIHQIEPGLWIFRANANGNISITTDCGGSLVVSLTAGDTFMFDSQDVLFKTLVAGHMVLGRPLVSISGDTVNLPIAVTASLAG